MEQQCAKLSPGLANVLFAVANVVGEISDILRSADADEQSGSHNKFGDSQLKLDMAVDALIFERLGSCSSVATASSEEKPESIPMPGSGYSVAFDPLDGSSIVGANFAVGTIFGIWKGSTIVGSSSREQVAAAYAVYGPRTVLVWACPRDQDSENSPAVTPSSSHVVQEFVLTGPAQKQGALKYRWRLQRDNVAITESKSVFAPANLRAAAENEAYQALVGTWMKRNFTLRYTGGMVPDVHHIIAKGGGVFCNPTSNSAPAKLRLLYECVPLALIIEAAGGSSHDGKGSLLDRVIDATSIRTKVCLGTAEMVESCIPALQAH